MGSKPPESMATQRSSYATEVVPPVALSGSGTVTVGAPVAEVSRRTGPMGGPTGRKSV